MTFKKKDMSRSNMGRRQTRNNQTEDKRNKRKSKRNHGSQDEYMSAGEMSDDEEEKVRQD